MINETDKLFINSTKAVNPTPKQDKLLGEVPIKEYIDFDSPEWSMFFYAESMKAYETYPDNTKVENITYLIIGPSVNSVVKIFLRMLDKSKVAAIATKLQGYRPGEGRLIFQCRNNVTLRERTDGRIQLSWRGKLDRIPSQKKTKPKRIPMVSYSDRVWNG